MSSSSDSEDDSECLKEAVDPHLFTNDLYKPKEFPPRDEVGEEKEAKRLPSSLRDQNKEVASFNPFQIRVTPEFRIYVSKHLRKKLDAIIDDTKELKVNEGRGRSRKRRIEGGVKLLRDSRQFLQHNSEETASTERKKLKSKRCKVRKEDDVDYEERAKEVAVSPDWILSKKEVESWAPETKGEFEVVLTKPSDKKGVAAQAK